VQLVLYSSIFILAKIYIFKQKIKQKKMSNKNIREIRSKDGIAEKLRVMDLISMSDYE
jgi:hypothetical protein